MDDLVLPSELQCPICSSLLEDAVMMPCCAGTACDSCARSGILRSVASACPVCGEVASTEELIPYRLFRDKVDKFCTQTGYDKARPPQQHHQPHKLPKPSLPDIVLPTLQSHRSSVTSSPRGTSPPRPQTPTSSPLRSPGTPLSYPERRSRSRSPVTPYPHHDGAYGRGTPTTSPEYLLKHNPPGPTLLPPVHVLASYTHWPQPPRRLPSPVQHPPTFLHPAEDPLAAFEAAMRKLDSKKSSRSRRDPASPPRAYRVERTRSSSRERLRDYRERDYSPRRRSPGGYGNCSPGGRKRGSSRGSSYLATSPHAHRTDSRNEGKGRDDKDDSVDASWSRPRRERYVTDIPPETHEERRDRERFERNLAKMDIGSYRPKTESRGRAAPNLEYQDRKMTENKAHGMDTRTPSLSPEPDIGEYEYGRWKVGSGNRENTVEDKDKKAVNLERLREEKDEENCGTKFKKEEERRCQDHKNGKMSQNDTRYDRGGERELSNCDGRRKEDARDQDRNQDGLDKFRKREDWNQDDGDRRGRDRSCGRDLGYVVKSESNRKLMAQPRKEESIDDESKMELSIDEAETKVQESLSKVCSGERLEDNKLLNQAAKQKSDEVEEKVGTDQGKSLSVEKELRNVKKSKKSKKNKSKDKERRKCDKESRKRKKSKKRRDEFNEELKPEEDVKSLVPYDEAEDTKTEDSSAENQEDKSSLTANFISSFNETKIESRRSELDLPSLVFHEKTEDLAPKKINYNEREKVIIAELQLYSESLPSSSSKEVVKGHSKAVEMKRNKNASEAWGSPEFEAVPSVSSKWEREDILTAEYPELKHPLVADPESALELLKPCIQESSSRPQNVLRKALANMEKDHLLRDKKRKSMEGLDETKSKKKKKKRRKKSRGKHGSGEEDTKLEVKKTKKRKSGLDISEKTLKKLLKKNLIRKEALEKMISDEGVRKKRKKKHSDGKNGKGKTMQSSSEDEINKKLVKVERLGCQDGEKVEESSHLKEEKRRIRRKEVGEEREGPRRGNRRGSSEEGREVKASKEGKIQVRLANSSNKESSSLVPCKKSLASTVQANLLKMAGQDSSGRGERGRRNSPQRKSVKDRLGPLRREHLSPVRRSSLREDGSGRNISKLDDHRLTGNRLEGRKKFGRDADESKKGADENIVGEDRLEVLESVRLEPVPATLQAWAGRHSPVKQDRDTRWSKEEDYDNHERKKDASVEKNCKERKRSSEKAWKSLKKRTLEKR